MFLFELFGFALRGGIPKREISIFDSLIGIECFERDCRKMSKTFTDGLVFFKRDG